MEVKQIRLEKYVSAQNGSGDWVETVTRYNTWAEVVRKGGDRSSLNGQTKLKSLLDFKVRFRPDYKPTGNWRVVYDGNRYTVHEIVKENEGRFYWIFKTNGIQC